MGGSRCGYCRDFNHNKRKCKKLAGEVEYIRKYIPAEMFKTHNLLVEKGWGLGAMVEVTDWAGNKHVGIIDDLRSLVNTAHNYTDFRLVKYSKQVKTFLKNFTGHYLESIPENILFHNKAELQFLVLNPSNPSERLYATVTKNMLGVGNDPTYSWTEPSVLLSPSYDTNLHYSDFLDMSIRLHDRHLLTGDDAYVKGMAI